MLHGYMFSIRSRDWIPVPAEISAGTGIPPYGILNLILLISRDAIHFGCCRYTHRSVAFLQADDLTRLPIREIAGITRHIALILGGLNKPIPPRVPRLAITLSSSESVARSFISLI